MDWMNRVYSTSIPLALVAYLTCILAADLPAGDRLSWLQLVDQRSSTSELLDCVLQDFEESRFAQGQLAQVCSDQLSFTNWNISGWRREFITRRGERIIIASDGPLWVVIRESRNIEFSVCDMSHGRFTEPGLTVSPRYAGYQSSRKQHIQATSAEHFARKNAELFRIYYYFAGPTSEIVSSHALPAPAFKMPP